MRCFAVGCQPKLGAFCIESSQENPETMPSCMIGIIGMNHS